MSFFIIPMPLNLSMSNISDLVWNSSKSFSPVVSLFTNKHGHFIFLICICILFLDSFSFLQITGSYPSSLKYLFAISENERSNVNLHSVLEKTSPFSPKIHDIKHNSPDSFGVIKYLLTS